MDQLFGIMELEGGELAPPPHHDPDVDSYVKGPLLLGQERTACNVDQSREIVASSGNVLAMVGEITNLADLSSARREDAGTDLEQIARLFAEGGLAGLGELEGLFTIAIFDRASDTLLVLQDRFSSQFTLYWVVRGSKLFFSTRLKKLLMLSGISREVDRSVLPDFMVNGLVPDGRTLMRNVSKLVPGEHLAARRGEGCGVHCGRRPLKDLAIPDIDPDPEHLARTYRRTVSRSLRRLIEPLGRDDLHMILTSGFDSNFSLHLARSLHAGPIHTYCIGTTDRGEFAGESRRAGTIAATYDGVEFHEEVLSGAAVLDLPDIVWRVEGAFCERGLFLRNRLARGVSAGSDHVFGGDLANQVLNPYFLHVPAGWNASNISKRLRLAMHSRRHRARSWNAAWGRRPLAWLYNPRELGLFMNIKQNGSLMSSYSVQLKYPYLDLEFVGLVLSIMRHQRVAALELHRRIIKSSVSPAVREVLGRPKKGPIREALYYQDPSFRRTVAAHVSRSAFLPSIVDRELLDRHLDLFVRSNVDALASVVNRLLFIDLWHRLFLTGDFDDQFSGPSLDSPPDFLSTRDPRPAGSMRTMRLAYVTDQWLPQPMTDTRQILNVVSAFGSIGLSVDLLVPRRRLRTGATVDELASYYQVQPTFHVRNVASVYPTMRGIEKVAHGLAATRLASRSRYDLLYTRNIPVLISALRLGRVPVVYETYRPWPSQRPGMGRLFRWMGGHGRFLGAVLHSRLAAGSYEAAGVPPERLLVAHNGHDPGMFEPALDAARARSRLGLPADARLAVYTGDIRPSKGIGLLLDMAVRVPDVRFILIGSSSEGAMERRARRIPNVDVLPRMPARDLVPFWFAADVLLIPPTRAPLARAGHTVLPFKTFEYMAAGRPILGPDTPDLREVLRDGESAALARPDDLDDAVHRLRTLMDDPQERARLSRACLERASGFTWTGRARAILSFLRRRLGSQD